MADGRPLVEREKGGVKLFVGRLPREVTQHQLRECFEEYGEVLEVFVIDSQAMSSVGCAFIRLARVEHAELAVRELHEQRVLLPERRELGPMQVAFARGEAVRLGLDEREETLPSFREARARVVEHREKRAFFEALQGQQESRRRAMVHQQQLQHQAAHAGILRTTELIALIKDGQRFGGAAFKHKWRSYCDQGWTGIYDYDPSHHPHEALAQFVMMVAYDHGQESWFQKRFKGLPLPPLGMPVQPPFGPLPGVGLPGMLLPPFVVHPGLGPCARVPPVAPHCGIPGGMPAPGAGGPDHGPDRSTEAPGRGSVSPLRVAEKGDEGPGQGGDGGAVLVPGRKLLDYTDVDTISGGPDTGGAEDDNNDEI